MARLQRSCHRLVWLNPLAGAPGYQPLAAGMQAAYPYIDEFLPAGTVASLERLGQILAGNSPGRAGRSAGRPHRRAGGHTVPRDLQAGGSAARRITPNPGAGKRLGAWATKGASPTPNSPRAALLESDGNPAAPRPLA